MQRVLLLLILLLLPGLSLAVPPIWETDFGDELTDLTEEDDETTDVTLSFPFPFLGTNYTTVFVGTNGGLQLDSLGDDIDIDYDHWEALEEFYSDGAPSITPFNSDLDLSTTGTIHFNDFGNRAVFTWNEIGTNQNETALLTFQVQLFADGRIVFGYNGILDGVDEDTLGDLDEGIVVGITGGEVPYGTVPAAIDLSVFGSFPTADLSERWCYDAADSCSVDTETETKATGADKLKLPTDTSRAKGSMGASGPINSAFDLDQTNVTFTPNGNGFIVNAALGFQAPEMVPTATTWGLVLLGAMLLVLAYRKRHLWQH